MIPQREQRLIQGRLEEDLRGRVRLDFFTQKPSPIVVPGRSECRYCPQVSEAVAELAALHPRLALTVHELAEAPDAARKLGVQRVPCIVVRGQANRAIRFYGLPAGTQFANLIETIVLSTHPDVPVAREASLLVRKLRRPVQLSVFVTPACGYSAAVANAACRLALAHAAIRAEIVEVTGYPELVQRFDIRVTPTTFFDGRLAVRGLMDEHAMAAHALESAETSAQLAPVDAGPATPFDPDAFEQQQRPTAEPGAPRIYLPGQ
jgi:alkyl hydroperoxide reductase subunit AhpF